jgi:predicted cupin superfamily sugar epimerase
MLTSDQLIEKLDLKKHPEGGYFKEIYRDDITLDFGEKYDGRMRNILTSIYFLLKGEDQSALHVIKNSTEIWNFHAGSPLQITIIDPITGMIEKRIIGNPAEGYNAQCVVPGNTWFGAECINKNEYSLVGYMVTPGFDYRDSSLIKEDQLLELLPNPPVDVLNLISVNADIRETEIIDASADEIWSIISDFNALPKWHPAILDSFIEEGKSNGNIGCVRNFNLKNNGGNIREELMILDSEEFLVKYKILDCPMPLSNYEAILKLEQLDSKTKITWECHFDCHQKNKIHLKEAIRSNIFQGGFEALRKQLLDVI